MADDAFQSGYGYKECDQSVQCDASWDHDRLGSRLRGRSLVSQLFQQYLNVRFNISEQGGMIFVPRNSSGRWRSPRRTTTSFSSSRRVVRMPSLGRRAVVRTSTTSMIILVVAAAHIVCRRCLLYHHHHRSRIRRPYIVQPTNNISISTTTTSSRNKIQLSNLSL